jgi:hypothetical protein
MEILEATNAHLGTQFPLDSSWQVFTPIISYTTSFSDFYFTLDIFIHIIPINKVFSPIN